MYDRIKRKICCCIKLEIFLLLFSSAGVIFILYSTQFSPLDSKCSLFMFVLTVHLISMFGFPVSKPASLRVSIGSHQWILITWVDCWIGIAKLNSSSDLTTAFIVYYCKLILTQEDIFLKKSIQEKSIGI